MPELFFDFSPGTKEEDATELKYLLSKSPILSHYEYIVDTRNPSEEKIKGVFEKIRQSLKTINAQKYDDLVANVDDYQLVKEYETFYSALKSARE